MEGSARRPLPLARSARLPARPAGGRRTSPPTLAEEMAALIGRSRREMRAEVERRLSARGESALAWLVLKRLVRLGPATQVELAEDTAIDPGSVSRLLEELEAQEAVRRRRDRHDRRRRVVAATARGLRRFEAMTPLVVAGVEERLRSLAPAEVLELRRLLRKLLGQGG